MELIKSCTIRVVPSREPTFNTPEVAESVTPIPVKRFWRNSSGDIPARFWLSIASMAYGMVRNLRLGFMVWPCTSSSRNWYFFISGRDGPMDNEKNPSMTSTEG